MNIQLKHVLMIVAVAVCGVAIEVFSKPGPWSHAFWLPVAISLLTELKTALGASTQPAVSIADVKAARITGSTAVQP